MGPIYKLTVILLINLSVVFGARILIHSPTASYSHQVIFQPIVRELSLRGHQVVSITTDPINDPKLTNLTEISVRFSYREFAKNFHFNDRSDQGWLQMAFTQGVMEVFTEHVYDKQLSYPEVKNLIQNKNESFDLVIVEYLFPSVLIAFSERFNCPLVGITTLHPLLPTNLALGNSINPSYRADINLPFSSPASFYDRLVSTIFLSLYFKYLHTKMYPEQNRLLKKHFGENSSSFEEISRRVSLVLTNSHPVIYGANPTVQNAVNILGIYRKPRRSLPEDLKEFLDSGTEGVIYFSLGSNVKSNLLPKEKRDIFIETFKDLPYKVLWKFESEDLPGKPDNVKISKWLPQSDVLYHPNVKLFITQGGVQSWEEAIHAQVPLIGFPFMGDQYWNVDRMEKLEIGIKMDIDTFDKQSLTKSIQTIINDPKYHNNIKKISNLLNDQPMKPLDTAIYWIEFVLRHGDLTLYQSPTMHIPWYQYFLLDVIAFLVTCFAVTLYLVYFIISRVLRLVGLTNSTKKSKQKIS